MNRMKVFLYIQFLLLFLSAFSSISYSEDVDIPQKIEFRQPENRYEFYRRIVDHTITATTNFGNNFTEFHAADGRVLGFNWGSNMNENSCWRVINKNTICYYYPNYVENSESCWVYTFLSKSQITGYVIEDPNQKMKAKVEQGDSESFEEETKRWECNKQIIAYSFQ